MCNQMMAAKNVNLCDIVRLCIWERSVRASSVREGAKKQSNLVLPTTAQSL